MEAVNISSKRSFSLASVQRQTLIDGDVQVELVCFEAGQKEKARALQRDCVYQVLEGEALVRASGERVRLGKGKLLKVDANTEHSLENAGGGLLVVMATSAR